MNLVSALGIVASCLSFILAGLVWQLRPRASLNRWVAVWCLVYGVETLGEAFVVSATGPLAFWLAYDTSRIMLAALLSLSVLVPVVFAGLRGWIAWVVVGPLVVIGIAEAVQFVTGRLFISGYYTGPWGNVGIPNTDAFWLTVGAIGAGYTCLGNLGVLAWAWKHHPAPRYRSFILKYLALNAVAMAFAGAGYFSWFLWRVPDTTFSFGLIYCLGMFALMSKYSFLSDNRPQVDDALLSNLRGSVLILDGQGKILKANHEAAGLLGKAGKQLEGRSLPEVLEGWQDLARLLETLSLEAAPSQPSLGKLGQELFVLTLTPSPDRFGQVQAIYARLEPGTNGEPEGRFGLSSREWEVARLVIEGLQSKEIADRLYISTGTVKNHIKSLFHKTGCTNRAQLVRTLLVGAVPSGRQGAETGRS